MSWEPIETKPRDGSWFATCRAGDPDSVEASRYVEPMPQVSFEHVEGDLYRRVVNHPKPTIWNSWQNGSNMHRATHWCALPLLPEAAE